MIQSLILSILFHKSSQNPNPIIEKGESKDKNIGSAGLNFIQVGSTLFAIIIFLWNSYRFFQYDDQMNWTYFYFIISASGFAFRLWCFNTLGRFFTFEVTIRNDHRLVDSGPYSVLIHPSYTGQFIGISGHLLFSGLQSIPIWLMIICSYWLLIGVRIVNEEKALQDKFGDAFIKFKEERWRLFPFVF